MRGSVTTDLPNRDDRSSGIAIDANGRIVLVGASIDYTGPGRDADVAMARYVGDRPLADVAVTVDGDRPNTFNKGDQVTCRYLRHDNSIGIGPVVHAVRHVTTPWDA